jgi:2-succinyl-6-hydroxy-2,4-cyclohexadiene-1-carboxylate synthase
VSRPASQAGRIVLVHGFTQTGDSWAPVAPLLGAATRASVLTPCLPGHGSSGREAASLAEAAAPLGKEAGAGVYVGYSMGGRMCLRLALDRPDLVERLVLVGATAGLSDPAEREARRASDEALAARVEQMRVEDFLDEWLAAPLFAHLTPEQAGRAARLGNTAQGLAWALRRLGPAAEPAMWGELARLSMPVLVLAGERDEKFSVLAQQIATAIGDNAEVARVAGAGHAAPFERPSEFSRLVAAWLGRTRWPGGRRRGGVTRPGR